MKKRYLRTVEDVLALKDTDTKIYNELGYYKFVNGILCYFMSDKDIYINDTLSLQGENPYIIEEEQKADEDDIGKLCWFWNAYDTHDKIVALLKGIDDRFYADNISYYRHCRPLTKEEIKEFMEKAGKDLDK